MVVTGGIEPPTPGFSIRCSTWLSYMTVPDRMVMEADAGIEPA